MYLLSKTLFSLGDDTYLRNSLPKRYYRIAKRARTRAIQQYLLWIASGCAAAQSLISAHAGDFHEPHALSAVAFRLRAAALGFWCLLWLQRGFPQFELMPGALIDRYEQLVGRMTIGLAAPEVINGISP